MGENERQANRTEVCDTYTFDYETWVTVDGVRTQDGGATIVFISYSYGDTGLGTIAHQLDTGTVSGWGAALKATMSAEARASDDCTMTSSTYPSHALSIGSDDATGEAFFDTTATALGDTGICDTAWRIRWRNDPYPMLLTQYGFDDFRCDNNTAGRDAVGCVIPWYPSALTYNSAKTPDLASHVLSAQASGLPGASFADPLTRTTDEAVINENRTKACGDAPSVSGKSCDEYPIATSQEGLSAGGTRRTFDDCGFANIPAEIGPTGVSICMITERDNQSQGGTNSQFFRSERVLQNDPFRVLIS